MFLTSDNVALFDYLRIPHQVSAIAFDGSPSDWTVVRLSEASPGDHRLLWPSRRGAWAGVAAGQWRLDGSPAFSRLLGDATMQAVLGNPWQPAEEITDARGAHVASIWRDGSHGIALPFDPDEALQAFWSEEYLAIRGGGRPSGPGRAVKLYYTVRPIIPRRLQIMLRRAFARIQARATFPRWPIEAGLHDLIRTLYRLTSEAAGGPVPWISPWPAPFQWAFVLTHDVETVEGVAGIGELREMEHRLGYRSSWNFVPRRYDVPDDLTRELARAGCEVGLHGLYHDGRDLASAEMLAERLPEMHQHAARWGAVGFRSPATQRSWELVRMLGFDYDSSFPDTDPYEPQAGGCCSWLPYHVGDVVELPITLPQDHTLYTILQHADANTWLSKMNYLRSRGGMALVLTHPDYQRTPAARAHYAALLEACAGDGTAWMALPREVSSWWRRRAASHVAPDGQGGWQVAGPAADEAVVSLSPPG